MDITKIIIFICIAIPTQTTALIAQSSSSEIRCNGHLRIAHEDEDRNVNFITLEGPRTAYRNIRRGFPAIRNNIINYIDTFGECCWEIYSNRAFRGDKHVIYPSGDLVYADFQPVSIKKVDCA